MECTVTIVNLLGLHARASAKLVTHASRYGAHIELVQGNRVVNAKSIMGVMMLAATKGTTLLLRAEGDDAAEAIQDLVQLIDAKFGEEE